MEKIMDNIVKFDFNDHVIFINKVILENPDKQNEKDNSFNNECKCKKKSKESNMGILKDFIEILINTIQNPQKIDNLKKYCAEINKEKSMYNENSNILSNNFTSFRDENISSKMNKCSNIQKNSKFDSAMKSQQNSISSTQYKQNNNINKSNIANMPQQSKIQNISEYSKQKNQKKSDQLRIGNKNDELKNIKIDDNKVNNKNLDNDFNDFSSFLKELISQSYSIT